MNIKFFFLVGTFYSFCGCNSLKVVTDYQNDADFSTYESFAIVEVDAGQTGVSALNLRRIISAVRTEMSAKALKEIHIHGLVKDKVTTNISTDYYGYRYGRYLRPFGYGISTVDVTAYKEGSLIIDLVDRAKDQLVWQGIGTAKLNENPKGRGERIQKAVSKILEGFPPSI